MFSFAVSRFLGALTYRLRDAGLMVELPQQAAAIFGGEGMGHAAVDLEGPASLDDVVLPIVAPPESPWARFARRAACSPRSSH